MQQMMVVSSVYIHYSIFTVEFSWCLGVQSGVYGANRRGPSTQPCGASGVEHKRKRGVTANSKLLTIVEVAAVLLQWPWFLSRQVNTRLWRLISIWRGRSATLSFRRTFPASWRSFSPKCLSGWTENQCQLGLCLVSVCLLYFFFSIQRYISNRQLTCILIK